jgi:DNA mismatch repair protein MutS2
VKRVSLQSKWGFLEDSKKAILKDAKKQAKEIIKNANKLIENTIAQIKESKANKEIITLLPR